MKSDQEIVDQFRKAKSKVNAPPRVRSGLRIIGWSFETEGLSIHLFELERLLDLAQKGIDK
jgi:hypothetical protein